MYFVFVMVSSCSGLDTDFHNWDVPFPAVTMCDLNPVDEDLLQEFLES